MKKGEKTNFALSFSKICKSAKITHPSIHFFSLSLLEKKKKEGRYSFPKSSSFSLLFIPFLSFFLLFQLSLKNPLFSFSLPSLSLSQKSSLSLLSQKSSLSLFSLKNPLFFFILSFRKHLGGDGFVYNRVQFTTY